MNTASDKATINDATSVDRALTAAAAAQDRKGFAVTAINVEGLCSYADVILIVSANSERQAAAIGESVQDAMRETYGTKPLHKEPQGAWVLIDFGDVLVHVFTEDTRAYYDLDQLWKDAPRIRVPAPESQINDPGPTALARRGRT